LKKQKLLLPKGRVKKKHFCRKSSSSAMTPPHPPFDGPFFPFSGNKSLKMANFVKERRKKNGLWTQVETPRPKRDFFHGCVFFNPSLRITKIVH